MAHYSLLNNDNRGDIETFLAASVQCDHCRAEAVVRLDDAIGGDPRSIVWHARDCANKLFLTLTPLDDWYYAFGSEGYNWVDDPIGPFPTEAAAKVDAAEKVAGFPPAAEPPIRRPYRPASYHEALGALDACYARLNRFDLAMRNAAYALEFLADVTPVGWRRDRAVNEAENLRVALREARYE